MASPYSSAKDDSIVRPVLLTLFQATNATVQNIKMINGPEWVNFVRVMSILPRPRTLTVGDR